MLLEKGQFLEPFPSEAVGQPEYSFWNCQHTALTEPNFYYWEGYASDTYFRPLPVAHAWLQMDDKPAAIDITWGTGLCYFGIPFQTDWIADLLKQRAAIGSSPRRERSTERSRRGLDPKAERQVLSYRCQLSLRILRDGLSAEMMRGG